MATLNKKEVSALQNVRFVTRSLYIFGLRPRMDKDGIATIRMPDLATAITYSPPQAIREQGAKPYFPKASHLELFLRELICVGLIEPAIDPDDLPETPDIPLDRMTRRYRLLLVNPRSGKHASKRDTTWFTYEKLPDAWREWIETHHPQLDPDAVFAKFRRHYLGLKADGDAARGKRSNWTKAWRNWCRIDAEGVYGPPTLRRTARAPEAPENEKDILYDALRDRFLVK